MTNNLEYQRQQASGYRRQEGQETRDMEAAKYKGANGERSTVIRKGKIIRTMTRDATNLEKENKT